MRLRKMVKCSERDGRLFFKVRVVPKASNREIVGEYDGGLRIRVAAPPADSAANNELIRVLAKAFGLPPRAVEISAGHSSRIKQVRVLGASRADLERLINAPSNLR